MHAISSYRGNRPTHPQTHRQNRLQYTAQQLARSVMTMQFHLVIKCTQHLMHRRRQKFYAPSTERLQLSPASTTVTKQYFTITTVNTSVTTVLLRCPSPCHCLVDNKYKISASFTITHRQKRKLNLSCLNRLKGLNCCSFGLEPIFRDGTEPEPGKNELNPNRTRSQNFGLFPISQIYSNNCIIVMFVCLAFNY